MNFKILVPVKGYSERVENKNMRPFFGSSLFELKLNQLKELFPPEDIVVNSEDEKMLSIANDIGVSTIKRDKYYTRNDVSMSEVYKNMAEHMDSEYIMYCNVTNPLVYDKTYLRAVSTFERVHHEFDSLNSCHDINEFLWLNNRALNYDSENQPRSQDLPNIVALNFAINIISRENMIKYKNVVGKLPYLFNIRVSESLDIDTQFDFFVAERCMEDRYNNKNSE